MVSKWFAFIKVNYFRVSRNTDNVLTTDLIKLILKENKRKWQRVRISRIKMNHCCYNNEYYLDEYL